ncbi:MAG: tyrosine-protein phosphatase [Calditrichaceae bacterium]
MTKMGYTDIHSHFLFGVDDGARNIDQSLKMLEQAASLDIRNLLATPHATEITEDGVSRQIQDNFKILKDRVLAEKIPVEISLGSELFFSDRIYHWLDYPWATFNGKKRYLLFELPLMAVPDGVSDFIFRCRLRNITPVIAHPERYIRLHDTPETIYEWYRQGCLIQVDAGSLTGQFGGKAAGFSQRLLKAGLCQFIASDAHDLEYRSYKILAEAYKITLDLMTPEDADRLFKLNPALAVKGGSIDVPSLDGLMINESWIDRIFAKVNGIKKIF